MIINFCVSFVVIYCTLYFFGYPLKVLLLNDDLRKFDLYITPWLGIGVIVVTLFPLSWLGYSVQSTAYYFAAAVAAANLAVWLKFREPVRVERREIALMAVTGLITASIYGGVLSLKGPEYFAVTLNFDLGVYFNDMKAALVSSARASADFPQGVPLIRPIYSALNLQLRGCVFVYAILSEFFGIDIIHATYILSSFIMFLNVITFRLFLRKSNKWMALILIAILPFNTFYQQAIFQAFIGQMFSVGLTTLAFYIEYYLSERRSFDPRTCLALVFVLTANGLCYMEGFVYPLLPAFSLMLAMALKGNYDKKSCFSNIAFVGFLYIIINFELIVILVQLFLFANERSDGWPAKAFVTMLDIAGARGSFESRPLVLFVTAMANVLCAFALIYQALKEKLNSFMSATFVMFFLLHLFFCAMYFRPGESSSYFVLKSALSLSFIVIIFILRFLDDRIGESVVQFRPFSVKFVSKSGLAAAVIFAAFFCLNVTASLRDIWKFGNGKGYGTFISSQHGALAMFSENVAYAGSDFIVRFDLQILHDIATYYSPWGRAYTTSSLTRGPGADTRNMKDSFKPGDIYVADAVFEEIMRTTDAELIFENDVYKIFQLRDESLLLYDDLGMSARVRVKSVGDEILLLRDVVDKRAGLRFLSLKEQNANFALSFYDGKFGDLSAKIYVNEEFVGEWKEADGFIGVTLSNLTMKPGINDISIEFSGDISELSLAGVEISR